MQFNVLAVILAVASVAIAENDKVYGVASPTATVASTGVVTAPTASGSPINSATGAGSVNGVSALGMLVAGGVALFL